jgi:phospholipid/cholesterol/gamma-HCH transport system permease protein
MADLIRRKGMSAVIISHDPECAAALGDPVYYFTPLAGELARMEASGEGERPSRGSILEWVERTKAQAPPPPERKPPVAPPPDESEWTRYKRAVLEGIDGLGAAVLFFRHLAALPSAAMLLRNLRLWGLESAGLVALIFALLGFVLQIQGESALVDFGFSNRLPEFQALALVRLAPFLAAILMAGRCGSAIAAQAGWQALSGQRRALMTMRIDPDRVFFPALFWSWALVLPVLTAIGMLAAWSGALLYLVSPLSSADLTVQAFINGLPRELETAALVGAAIKSAIMAGGLAAIAYGGGSRAEGSIAQVMGAITGGLVLSFVWISLVDTGLSLVFQS